MSIAVGQHTAESFTGASGTTGALTTAASGSTFLLCILANNAGVIQTPTDSKSNSYVPIDVSLTPFIDNRSRCYYAANATGGSSHTFSIAATSAANLSVWVIEITGASSASLDQQASVADFISAYDSPGITTTQAAELLIGFFAVEGDGGTYTFTPGNSFTNVDSITDGNNFLVGQTASRIVAATSTYNTTLTAPGSPTISGVACWIMSFKESAGGAVTITPGVGVLTMAGRTGGMGFGINMPDVP